MANKGGKGAPKASPAAKSGKKITKPYGNQGGGKKPAGGRK